MSVEDWVSTEQPRYWDGRWRTLASQWLSLGRRTMMRMEKGKRLDRS